VKDKDRELRLILEKYYLPAISLDLAQGEIKALYKPLGKEELDKIFADVFVEHFRLLPLEIARSVDLCKLRERLAEAIINARGEKR